MALSRGDHPCGQLRSCKRHLHGRAPLRTGHRQVLALLATGVALTGNASASKHRPCELLPLRAAAASRPLTGGLGGSRLPHEVGIAMGGRPCMGAARGWPPLLLLVATRIRERLILPREIVYPCILDPNGEDEGGQAPSSLAVSTRWNSVAKLLQFELATLA
ncbi:hypothetical protein BHM03_00039562 [Ensete ventricosum]|nr:hypothetical protein BHM03_00039562 [Ensete ventricosum]